MMLRGETCCKREERKGVTTRMAYAITWRQMRCMEQRNHHD